MIDSEMDALAAASRAVEARAFSGLVTEACEAARWPTPIVDKLATLAEQDFRRRDVTSVVLERFAYNADPNTVASLPECNSLRLTLRVSDRDVYLDVAAGKMNTTNEPLYRLDGLIDESLVAFDPAELEPKLITEFSAVAASERLYRVLMLGICGPYACEVADGVANSESLNEWNTARPFRIVLRWARGFQDETLGTWVLAQKE